MRKALLASLILSPVLLHAQANTPAQPQVALASAPAVASGADRGTTPQHLRISTGVVAPKIIHSVEVSSATTHPWIDAPANRTVTVSMIVDTTGKPTDLKIVKSAGLAVDKNVLAAVSQYRFQPGTVSNQPIDFPVNLEITLVPAR